MAVSAEIMAAIEAAVASAVAAANAAQTSSNVASSQAGSVTDALQASIKSLTEQMTKLQTEQSKILTSQTEDIRKSLDVGGDESEKRGVADASNEWSGIARHRASMLARSSNVVDWAFANAAFANNIAQLSMVREFDQQGSCNWRKRCGEGPPEEEGK